MEVIKTFKNDKTRECILQFLNDTGMENCVSQFKGWFGKSKIKVKCVWTDLDECSEKST